MKRLAFQPVLAIILLLAHFHPAPALQGGTRKESPKPTPGKSSAGAGPKSGAPRSGTTRAKATPAGKKVVLAELTVNTDQPGCQISLDGGPPRATDQSGTLKLPSLKAGPHTLVARKPNYHEATRTVYLNPGQSSSEFIALTPMEGTLNVTPNVAGTEIEVEGIGKYVERVAALAIAPGSYRLTVTKLGYRTVTREFVVKSSETVTLPIGLEKLTLDELFAQATENFVKSNYERAIALAREILILKPDLPQAYYLLAYSYYRMSNYGESIMDFQKVLSFGGKDVFTVRHRHNAFEMCTGTLTLTKTGVSFQSSTNFGHDFVDVPYSKFKEFFVEIGTEGVLHTKVRIPKSSGRKGEDEKDYNFYVEEAATPVSTIGCNNCRERMEVINQIMLWARRQMAGNP